MSPAARTGAARAVSKIVAPQEPHGAPMEIEKSVAKMVRAGPASLAVPIRRASRAVVFKRKGAASLEKRPASTRNPLAAAMKTAKTGSRTRPAQKTVCVSKGVASAPAIERETTGAIKAVPFTPLIYRKSLVMQTRINTPLRS